MSFSLVLFVVFRQTTTTKKRHKSVRCYRVSMFLSSHLLLPLNPLEGHCLCIFFRNNMHDILRDSTLKFGLGARYPASKTESFFHLQILHRWFFFLQKAWLGVTLSGVRLRGKTGDAHRRPGSDPSCRTFTPSCITLGLLLSFSYWDDLDLTWSGICAHNII